MMGELERSHIDRNSPIWGGSDCIKHQQKRKKLKNTID